MLPNFKLILESFGFPKNQLCHDTALAFLHEIYAYLADIKPIDQDSIDIEINTSVPRAMVTCNAKMAPESTIDDAISDINRMWSQKLNYLYPRYSEIRATNHGDSATIACITIGQQTACTIRFSIEGSQPMNRLKREEANKRRNARKGLSPTETESMDQIELREQMIMKRAREIHTSLFSEEYNFMYVDAFGEPKPSPALIIKKNTYRAKHRLPLLDENGKSDSFQGATLMHCHELARKELR